MTILSRSPSQRGLAREGSARAAPGIETVAGVVEGPDGLRLRTITTAPPGAGRLAAVSWWGWLSCDSVELRADPAGWTGWSRDVVRKSKPWYFASTSRRGRQRGRLRRTDFTTSWRDTARLRAFRQHPRVDPARVVLLGISNGGGFSPLVAGDSPVAAYVSVGGWSKTWFEHMIELERRRLRCRGRRPAASMPP